MSLENTQAQVDDQALQFKKRARRRLVGAIALVLIMVAVLPMVLDDRTAKQPQQEIAISIPSQESTDFSSKIVPVAPANPSQNSASPANQPSASPDKLIEDKMQTTLSEAPTPAPLPQVEKKPAAKEEAVMKPSESNSSKTGEEKITEKQSETKAASKKEPAEKPKESTSKETASKDKPKSSDKSTEKTTSKSADTSKAKADQAKDNADTQHKIVVQIGVFSDANNVKQMQQKLSQAGIKAYTEQLSTDKGEKTRLRAGPYASRQEADSALEKVKSLGMPGMVISK